MRTVCALVLTLFLAGCNRGQDKDAVRQAVLDYLQNRGFNMTTMDVSVTGVQFKGTQADANVSISAKGAAPGQGMSRQYQLEQKNGKWAVVVSKEAGASPHGGGMVPGGAMPPAGGMPGAENPHGGAMPAPGAENPHGGGRMPSPEDLPPATKKK